MKDKTMKKLTLVATVLFACACNAADLIFHVDLNTIQLQRPVVSTLLKEAAASGYTHILWEVEDKVVFDTCPEAAHPEAFTKDEFRKILAESKALGLKNVPLLQTFGHAEYILRLEKYRPLRELDGSTDCYCVSNPGTRELLKKLIAEYLELFDGKEMGYFHMGGDECYDFCKCPVCSKRNAMELYGEHLNALVGPIRDLGIRPCIWNDMLVKPEWEKDIDAIPKDFVVFHWDYYHGNRNNPIKWRDKLQYLIDHGFTCAFAAASACGGDDPFLPGLEFHRKNIEAGWAEVKKHNLAALCVTSWSVRQNSKELQLPLIRFAGTGKWTLPDEYDALSKWDPNLCGLDGRGWHRYKDATVPPPGELKRVLKDIDTTKTDINGRPLEEGGSTYRQGLVDSATEIRKGVLAALPKVSGRWKEAGELKLQLLDAILTSLRGGTYEAIPLEESERYFGGEQTPRSAKNSAAIVWGLYTPAAVKPELVFHMNFNCIQMRRGLVTELLREIARDGYTSVLWEIEDKVRLDSCPEAAHPEAFTKDEFRSILAEAEALGLRPIPLLQTFGHAEYVLSKKAYAHLREVPENHDCYCVSKPEVRALLLKMEGEYLELFGDDVKWFHLGGDECRDLCKCPVCSQRKPLELYAEHLACLSAPLKERGIRPCIWDDMLVKEKYRDGIAAIPKDYFVWHWDYGIGNGTPKPGAFDKLQFLLDRGYDCAFTAACASGGDDPFMPRLEAHRNNLSAARELTARHALKALCVTSWSVRQNSKRLQIPLIRYAATGRWELGPEYDALTKWHPGLCGLDGRGWRRYQDAVVPPPGELARILKRIDKEKVDYRAQFIGQLQEVRKGVLRAMTKVDGQWLAAAKLKVSFIDAILAALRNERYEAIPFEDTVRYFDAEQTPYSARNAAEVVWGLYRPSEDGAPVLQRRIDEAVKAGKKEVVVTTDLTFFQPVTLPSDMTVVFDGCTLTLAPKVWSNFFVSRGTKNVGIVGRNGAVLDGGAPNELNEHTHRKNGLPHVRRNCPVLFTDVHGIRIENLTVRNHRYWGLTFQCCSDATIRDIVFDARHDRQNQDGIDLRNGCHHFTIENISGQTGDDMVALSAIDWGDETKGGECFFPEFDQDIHDIVIGNVVGAAQNHPLVALRNSNGVKLYNVNVKGVRHTHFAKPCHGAEVPRYGLVRIGNNMYFAKRAAEPGETKNIVLEDLDTGYALRGVVLAAAVDDLTIRNIRGWGVCRTLVTTDGPKFAGPPGVKATNVRIENAVLETNMPGAKLFDFDQQRPDDYTNGFVAVNCAQKPSAAPKAPTAEWAPAAVTIPSTRDGSWQSFYMWKPEDAAEKTPLLVALHTWSYDMTAKDPGATLLAECKKRGWAFCCPNFRGVNNTPEACGSEFAVQDVQDAVAWMTIYANVDKSRVYVTGKSGGGMMTLLQAASRGAFLYAGAAAFCPVSDLARWHGVNGHYGKMMAAACGGTPKEKPEEYVARSPLTHLAHVEWPCATYIATGIHDGHKGSVPVGHAIRAYNALAKAEDRISEEDVAFIEANERVPAHLAFKGRDPFYGKARRIHLRKTSGNVQLTIFEGGHEANFPAALDFLSRQRAWDPADWTLP